MSRQPHYDGRTTEPCSARTVGSFCTPFFALDAVFFVFCLTLMLNFHKRQWLVNSLDGFAVGEMLALG